ncbi:MAG: isoprenylcysteine carboxylmethyltransferase family protein [Planctomycetota bacterium]|nr:isoprenylcysteine carboxylmethyltransferase family protein [Planctomycetota bacterium]
MNLDRWFPFAFLALYVVLALLRSGFALASRPKGGAGETQREGAGEAAPAGRYEGFAGKAFRTLAAAALALGVTVYGFFHTFGLFEWWGRFEFPLPAWLRAGAALATLAAIGGLYWAHATLGTYFSVDLEFKKRHALITAGPYAYVRHPMYSAFVLFFAASAVLAANALIAAFSALLVLYILQRIPAEERMMRERFGAEYDGYAKTTGRLLPKLGVARA